MLKIVPLSLQKKNKKKKKQVKTATIKVDEYVLPKFEIGIDSPRDFMPEDKKVHVVVRAHYTHGKPIKCTAIVEVETYSQSLLKKTVVINGQETIEFDIEKDLKYGQNTFEGMYRVTAKVTENLTGLSQECGIEINVHSSYVIRINSDTQTKFKRGSTAYFTVCLLYIHRLFNY